MEARARAHGVTPIVWVDVDGVHVAVARGPAEAASHVESSVMQAVQEAVVMAKVETVERKTGKNGWTALLRVAAVADW